SMPAGAARNAIDCALWDLEAHRQQTPVWRLLGLASAPGECHTMRTVSIDTPNAMAAAATALAGASTLKVKVGGDADIARLEAVHQAVPEAGIVVDANESWTVRQLESWLPRLSELGVVVLEQPLPAGQDEALAEMRGQIPLCADESCHDRGSFADVVGRYDMVNVKLDKAGGLTEAIAVVREAQDRGLELMIGCMVSTSLAVAPALLLAEQASFVDLDGPFLLERDRDAAPHDVRASLLRSSAAVWGA
ncbi:MAG: enolase C-terminal domain-like protein, partial [Polyangiales bacterium]